MANCERCQSERLLNFGAKCSDAFWMQHNGKEYVGYVPDNLNVGGHDYIDMVFCLDCGQIQADFPVPEENVEKAIEELQET